MQNRQPENMDQMGNDGPRRALLNSFVAQMSPYHPTPNYLHFQMPMESSIRNYDQQSMSPGRYWQNPTGMEPLAYGKQGRLGGNLDLGEIVDIIDTSSKGGAHEATMGARPSSEAASAVNVTTFNVNSFRDEGAKATDRSIGTDRQVDSSGAKAMISLPSLPLAEPTKSNFTPETSNSTVSVDSTTRALVDAAYAPLSETNSHDLKTEKIAKNRKIRCKFPDCPNRARVSQHYGNFCNRHVIVVPCGFPGCRDKAMERASMCVKHLELGKEALHKILSARTQNVPVCRTSGCFKNDQGRGYCRGHEKLMMATGHLPAHVNKRRLNSAYTMCSYPECTKHSQRNHLCRTHGNLLITQAKELADRPGAVESFDVILARMQKNIRRCTRKNCTKNSQRDRLCTTHYFEKHNAKKDGPTPSTSRAGKKKAARAEKKEIIQQEEECENDARAVKRTRCGEPECENSPYATGLCVEHSKESKSQGPPCDSFSSKPAATNSTADDDSEGKEAFAVREQLEAAPVPLTTTGSKCTNLMCDRESYGRDYCDACLKLFSPLTMPMHDSSTALTGYPFRIASGGIAQTEERKLFCRVENCGLESGHGGLCASHFRAFETGILSVDQVNLNSRVQQHTWELAQAAAEAAAAADTKHASSTMFGKARKYYCKIDGCDKQAQKRNLCKRHHRLHEGDSADTSQNFMSEPQHSDFSQPTTACRFPGCLQSISTNHVLCLEHSEATLCWQSDCENLVARYQFCTFHAFRKQCAFEGCMYSAGVYGSGCAHHENAPKCHHDFCDKFAVGSDGAWCRLHQISCHDSPCALCRLRAHCLDRFTMGEDEAVKDENSNQSQENANVAAVMTKDLPGSGSGFDGECSYPRQM